MFKIVLKALTNKISPSCPTGKVEKSSCPGHPKLDEVICDLRIEPYEFSFASFRNIPIRAPSPFNAMVFFRIVLGLSLNAQKLIQVLRVKAIKTISAF
jgi:hypothetical protein